MLENYSEIMSIDYPGLTEGQVRASQNLGLDPALLMPKADTSVAEVELKSFKPIYSRLSDIEWCIVQPFLPSRGKSISKMDMRAFLDSALYMGLIDFKWSLYKYGEFGLSIDALRKKMERYSCHEDGCIWISLWQNLQGKLGPEREREFRTLADRGLAERNRITEYRNNKYKKTIRQNRV
jgi:hypothetical protein